MTLTQITPLANRGRCVCVCSQIRYMEQPGLKPKPLQGAYNCGKREKQGNLGELVNSGKLSVYEIYSGISLNYVHDSLTVTPQCRATALGIMYGAVFCYLL